MTTTLTPLTAEQLQEAYETGRYVTDMTGVKIKIVHIEPINGEMVLIKYHSTFDGCNFQTSRENIKGNEDLVGYWAPPQMYCNGEPVPTPLTNSEAVFGHLYFTPDFSTPGITTSVYLRPNDTATLLVQRGMLFKTKHEAEVAAIAMLKWSKEGGSGII